MIGLFKILVYSLFLLSDSCAIRLVAVSDDLHWLACSDSTQTVHIFSLKKMKVCKYNRLKLQQNLYYAAVTLGYLSLNKYRYDQAKSKSSKGDGNMEVVITRLRVMFQENE